MYRAFFSITILTSSSVPTIVRSWTESISALYDTVLDLGVVANIYIIQESMEFLIVQLFPMYASLKDNRVLYLTVIAIQPRRHKTVLYYLHLDCISLVVRSSTFRVYIRILFEESSLLRLGLQEVHICLIIQNGTVAILLQYVLKLVAVDSLAHPHIVRVRPVTKSCLSSVAQLLKQLYQMTVS